MTAPGDRGAPTKQSQIAECRLDLPGLCAQRDRYRSLGRYVTDVRRTPGRLDVGFRTDVDETLLSEALAVERECCPFFELDYEPASHLLSVRVEDDRQDLALDAIRVALGEADR